MRISRFLWCVVCMCVAQSFARDTTAVKKNIAIMTLKNGSGVGVGEAELITDRLGTELFQTGMVNVMERNQMNDILKEQGFQQSGACTEKACLVEMGQLLGVELLISGSLGKLGSLFLINLRAIDVRTGQIVRVVSEDIKGSIEDAVSRLGAIAAKLVGSEPPTPVVERPQPEPGFDIVQPQTPPATAEKEDEPAREITLAPEKEDKNSNRSGLRLGYTFFPRTPRYTRQDTTFEPDQATWFQRADLHFLIGIGPLFAITVGPSYGWAQQQFNLTTGSYSYIEATMVASYHEISIA